MNGVFALLNQPLLRQVGWALVHSLWQGALVGMGFAVLRFVLRRRSANARYLAGCLCLGLLTVAPLLTLLRGLPSAPASASGSSALSGPAGGAPLVAAAANLGRPYTGNGPLWSVQGGADLFTQIVPFLAAGWLLGVAFFSVRLTRSCWWMQSIRSRDCEPVEATWVETLDELRRRLRVSRPVGLLRSALVAVPTVVGWLRPVILLPASTLTGLTPGQLEAILAHELAHVRRLDYIVNACQCLVETLMFYHPVAWWISRCIREERENCCDDLVIEVCGDRLGYARALATLEGLRAELPEWSFAASGGSLLNRVRRLVGVAKDRGPATTREASGLALLGVGVVLIVLGIRIVVGPTVYQSTARICINPDASNTSGLADPRLAPNYDPYFMQTEFELIQSEVVLGKVIEHLDLNHVWGKKYGGGAPLKTWEAAGLLRKRLAFQPVRNTRLVEVRVSSDTPEEATRIANAVAEAYKAVRDQQQTQRSREGLKALEERFQEQEEKVKRAQQAVDKLRGELNISDVAASAEGPNPMMTADTLRKLESLRVESKAEYVKQATLLQRLQSLQKELGPEKLASPLLTAVPDALLNSYLERLSAAEQQLVALSKEFGPGHMEVVKVKGQIEDLHTKIRDRVQGIMLGLDVRVASLRNSLDNLDKEVANATQKDIQMADRSRPYF